MSLPEGFELSSSLTDDPPYQSASNLDSMEIVIRDSIGYLSRAVSDDPTPNVVPTGSVTPADPIILLIKTYLLSRVRGHPCEQSLLTEVESRISAFLRERNSKSFVELQQMFWRIRKFRNAPVQDLAEEYRRSQNAQQEALSRSSGKSSRHVSGGDHPPFRRCTMLRQSTLPCLCAGGKVGVPPYNYRVAPLLQDEQLRVILSSVSDQLISFLLPDGRILRLSLSNPIALPSSFASSYRCDTCAGYPSHVAFQSCSAASTCGSVCDIAGKSDVTMCLPCAVYFVHESFIRMRDALSPPRYLPFNDNVCKMDVWSAVYEGNTVWVTVELKPRNLYLCVWQLVEDASISHLPFSEQFTGVAVPTGTWGERGTIVSVHKGEKQYDPAAVCPICLEPFNSFNVNGCSNVSSAVMKTSCQHWFHVRCLADLRWASSSGRVCPICRSANYIPNAGPSETYEVKLSLASSAPGARPPAVRIAVAALLDEQYANPTSVVACQVLNLCRGEEFRRQGNEGSCSPM